MADRNSSAHPETQHWAVTVRRNHEDLVTIESNCLSGKSEFSDEDARVIRMAADHLSAFIGPERTPEDEPFIPCDHDYVWVQENELNGTQYRCDLCGHVKWARLKATGHIISVAGQALDKPIPLYGDEREEGGVTNA
jgi:hypothetical protein